MSGRTGVLLGLLVGAGALGTFAGCSAGDSNSKLAGNGGNGSGGLSNGGSGGFLDSGTAGAGGADVTDPETCAEAADRKTYVGCDLWPTVTANGVWSIFDFAVVAANAGNETASVTVTIGDTGVATAEIPPNELRTIFLPWIPVLKGPEGDQCNQITSSPSTARLDQGAFHLVSTRPIAVYQFNPLQYASIGGPPGKDWTKCKTTAPTCPFPTNCNQTYYTYTNDASLLLPSTAMTGNYRVAGRHGYFHPTASFPEFMTITGTQDNTEVNVYVSATGTIEAGGPIAAVPGGGSTTLSLNAGDVVQLMTYTKLSGTGELSGSLIQANKPVQVIAGTACSLAPDDKVACDHTEESLLPAETFGKHYFVTPPTGPNGDTPGHIVRIYGNFDGTHLSYPSGTPAGAPSSLNAGQWVDLGVVQNSFEVEGDQAFAVASFQLGGSLVDPDPTDPNAVNQEGRGDPSMSYMTAVEQYRTKYVFLAPSNYDLSYADIVMPMDAQLELDGAALTLAPSAIGSGYGVVRVGLGPGQQGAHILPASAPVGLQVIGYGRYTSYQYPGGMNLKAIAPPPDPPR
ncbi:MAG: IgGFc-binding protein [Polyangiaceae bacterium]